MTSLSRSSIYAYMDKGIFPNQVKVGARAACWIEQEITDWLKGRILVRDAENSSTY